MPIRIITVFVSTVGKRLTVIRLKLIELVLPDNISYLIILNQQYDNIPSAYIWLSKRAKSAILI